MLPLCGTAWNGQSSPLAVQTSSVRVMLFPLTAGESSGEGPQGTRQRRQATVILERTDRACKAQERTTGGARMLKGEDDEESARPRTIWTEAGLCGNASVGNR